MDLMLVLGLSEIIEQLTIFVCIGMVIYQVYFKSDNDVKHKKYILQYAYNFFIR